MLYILSVCVALVIQHAKRMHRIVLSSAASLTPPYFSTLSHKLQDFRKKLLNIKCFLSSLQILCKTFFVLRRIQRDIVINVKTISCKISVILVGF